jgi:hypothetical protein
MARFVHPSLAHRAGAPTAASPARLRTPLQWRHVLTLMCAVAACAPPRSVPPPPTVAEQLTCGDSATPRATYARAKQASRADSLAGLAVVVEDSSGRRLQSADVQAWGPTGAVGEPGNPSGLTVFTDRDPGLYSLRLRLQADGPRWIYAVTLRPNYVDTATVIVGTKCTLIWSGR